MNEETSKIKIKEFYSQTRHVFIEKGENLEKNNAKIAEYNADEEAFKIITSSFGIWLMPVPLAEAPHFKEKNTFEKKLVVCNIENDHITLEKLAFQTKDGRIFSCRRP